MSTDPLLFTACWPRAQDLVQSTEWVLRAYRGLLWYRYLNQDTGSESEQADQDRRVAQRLRLKLTRDCASSRPWHNEEHVTRRLHEAIREEFGEESQRE